MELASPGSWPHALPKVHFLFIAVPPAGQIADRPGTSCTGSGTGLREELGFSVSIRPIELAPVEYLSVRRIGMNSPISA